MALARVEGPEPEWGCGWTVSTQARVTFPRKLPDLHWGIRDTGNHLGRAPALDCSSNSDLRC